MSTRSHIPVAVERAYDIWLWLDARVADFPISARHGVGRRVLDTAIDLLDAYLRATYAPRRSGDVARSLVDANQRLALLRLLLRGSRERRYLSIAQHEYVAVADLTPNPLSLQGGGGGGMVALSSMVVVVLQATMPLLPSEVQVTLGGFAASAPGAGVEPRRMYLGPHSTSILWSVSPTKTPIK